MVRRVYPTKILVKILVKILAKITRNEFPELLSFYQFMDRFLRIIIT